MEPTVTSPRTPAGDAAASLARGIAAETAGRLVAAAAAFTEAVQEGERAACGEVLADALRHLAIVNHRRQMEPEAESAVRRAHDVASALNDRTRMAEALNTWGSFSLVRGQLDEAVERYEDALAMGRDVPLLRARILQNMGIVANIRGEHSTALAQYTESLHAYTTADNTSGCAIAYHNLGMIHVDRGNLDDADSCFRHAFKLASAIDDDHQRAVCLINHCEVFLAREQYAEAKAQAERALTILDAIGEKRPKADAYKVLGIVYRETKRPVMAESRFRASITVAVECGTVLVQAEATRELAILARQSGRNQEALQLLSESHRLFGRLQAHVDIVDVASREADLERVYLDVVRGWGESIESADAYTHGHCARVADYATAVGAVLGLDRIAMTTIRVGAYLHDLGKVRVPHEILNKAGRLSGEEFALMKRHPMHGVELLDGIEFPWNIIPIIRWHHEKFDGTGYPDGLSGEDIPLQAQIVCIADVFDALTSSRSYRGAMAVEDAQRVIRESAAWWRPDVFEAFFAARLPDVVQPEEARTFSAAGR